MNPADGTVGVPTNARVLLEYYLAPLDTAPLLDAQLVAEDGSSVDADVTFAPGPPWSSRVLVTPRTPLAPNTTYEVMDRAVVPCELQTDCFAAVPSMVSRFTTGASPDTTPPVFAGITSIEQHHESCNNSACCGPYEADFATLDFASATDDGPHDTVRYDVYDGDQLVLAFTGPGTTLYQVCSGSASGIGSLPTHSGTFTVRAVDLAGNESADVEADRKTIDFACGCGCRIGGPSTPHGLWLIVGLIFWRRRASPRRARPRETGA